MDPLGIALLAFSALTKYEANNDASERREAFRRRMEAYQRTKVAEAGNATEQLLAKQTPEARGVELAEIGADRGQSLRDTVGAAQAFDAPQIAGKLSGDYRAGQEANATRVAERTRRAIEQLATMGAPQEQAEAFGKRFGTAATRVDGANSAMENVTRGYAADIEDVRPDPFLGTVSQLGTAVGQGMLSNAGALASENAKIDAGVNNGQGYEDAAGNLYNSGVSTRQDARIQKQLGKALSLWGR